MLSELLLQIGGTPLSLECAADCIAVACSNGIELLRITAKVGLTEKTKEKLFDLRCRVSFNK